MLKTMLVHLAGTAADEAVFSQAIVLAQACEAHLECVHVRPSKGQSLNLAATSAIGVGVEPNIGEILESLEAGINERAANARAMFDKLSKAQGVALVEVAPNAGTSAAFVERTGEEVEILIGESRGHDAVFVAGGGVEGGLRTGDCARLLAESGRPVILSPAAPEKNVLDNVAIAWKPTPESARALGAAMPFLTAAKKVTILTASEGSYEAGEDATRPIASHLAWHGVKAGIRNVLPAGRSASEAVLDAARDERASMLVMGAYGRGRLSEIVFGGFTQSVLDHTELPVFLLH